MEHKKGYHSEKTIENLNRKFAKAGMSNLKNKFFYDRSKVYELIDGYGYSEMDIYIALVSDHLFYRNEYLPKTEDDIKKLKNHLSVGQYLVTQQLFYKVRQDSIDIFEKERGLLSYRWSGKCGDKLLSLVKSIKNRLQKDKETKLSIIDRTIGKTNTIKKIQQQFNKTWYDC